MNPIDYSLSGLGQFDNSDFGDIPVLSTLACQDPVVLRKSQAPKVTTILLVDDEPTTRQLLTHDLEQAGYQVVIAENGSQALEEVADQKCDLILMDINMPILDGLTTLRLMRQIPDSAAIPVIIMTSENNEQQIVRCFENGASDYVAKPVKPAEMMSRIDAQLRLVRAQAELCESEKRYALAALGTRDGIWDWDLVTGELYLSQRWRDIVGLDLTQWDSASGSWLDLVYQEDQDRVHADLESHLCGESPFFESELRMPDRDGGFRWMLCRGLAVRNQDGMATRIAGSLTDITEGKVADALTRLPNRTLFYDRVTRCVQQYKRNQNRLFAVLYLDLDDFKLINDTLGHSAGDEFLIEIASRLDGSLRKCDAILARLGGDEFGILLENISGIADAVSVAKRIKDQASPPVSVADQEILPYISIGIAMASPHKTSADELISQADTAMYEAKQSGNKPICVFDDRMRIETAAKLEISTEIKHAIRRDEMSLLFQPIIEAKSMKTAGFEALLRWTHPVHGPISPSEFIPIAESNGAIFEIGTWVLQQACDHASQWKGQASRPIIVSVNVSVRQFGESDFVQQVRQAVQRSGISPSQLKLEVTETLLMRKPDEMIAVLNELKDSGVTTGIDDFGTGYSSLAYLHQMPLNVLKIDKSFVEHLQDSRKHQAIVRSIITLARSLELKVIAEGIENSEQAAYLHGLGCDYFQGFLYSTPVDAGTAQRLVNHQW